MPFWLATAAFSPRRAGTVLTLAVLRFAGAATLASRLELRTSFVELLPSDDPGVVAPNKLHRRMGDMTLLRIGIRWPDKQANLRYAELVTEKLRALPQSVVEFAAHNVRDPRWFFETNTWLCTCEDDLTEIRDHLRREIGKRKNPPRVELGGDDEESVDRMKGRLASKDWVCKKFPDGDFSNEDGAYV